jgi:hypothetical protein
VALYRRALRVERVALRLTEAFKKWTEAISADTEATGDQPGDQPATYSNSKCTLSLVAHTVTD